MYKYNADEIFQFALRIEKNGEHLYRVLAEKNKQNGEIFDFFSYLADEELKHKDFFDNILKTIKDYELSDNYTPEYFEYLRAFADNAIFSDNDKKGEIENTTDIIKVFDYAIKKEFDSINYYNELKTFVSNDDKNKIEQIINEEKKHFLDLYRKKMRYAKR